jgi:hypothetical protein
MEALRVFVGLGESRFEALAVEQRDGTGVAERRVGVAIAELVLVGWA